MPDLPTKQPLNSSTNHQPSNQPSICQANQPDKYPISPSSQPTRYLPNQPNQQTDRPTEQSTNQSTKQAADDDGCVPANDAYYYTHIVERCHFTIITCPTSERYFSTLDTTCSASLTFRPPLAACCSGPARERRGADHQNKTGYKTDEFLV